MSEEDLVDYEKRQKISDAINRVSGVSVFTVNALPFTKGEVVEDKIRLIDMKITKEMVFSSLDGSVDFRLSGKLISPIESKPYRVSIDADIVFTFTGIEYYDEFYSKDGDFIQEKLFNIFVYTVAYYFSKICKGLIPKDSDDFSYEFSPMLSKIVAGKKTQE